MLPISARVLSDVAGLRVCLSVCLSVTWMSRAKTAEPIERRFGGETCVSPRNHVLDVGICAWAPSGEYS